MDWKLRMRSMMEDGYTWYDEGNHRIKVISFMQLTRIRNIDQMETSDLKINGQISVIRNESDDPKYAVTVDVSNCLICYLNINNILFLVINA
jgi:hypothetical protein